MNSLGGGGSRIWARILVVLITLVLAIPPLSGLRYPLRTFTSDDGLPTSVILSISQDEEGFLWVGTALGVSRFDGREFVDVVPLTNRPGPVRCLVPRRAGGMWAGTDDGLARIEGTEWYPVEGIPSLSVRSLVEDETGLWVGTYGGLFRLENGESQARFRPLGTTSPAPHIRTMAMADGALWIGTYGEGLLEFRDGAVKRFGDEEGLTDPVIRSLFIEEDGRLLAGTNDGVFRYHQGVFAPAGEFGTLAETTINVMLRDRKSRLWIGTRERGACVYDGDSLRCLGPDEGLGTLSASALFEDSEGSVWIGTYSGGISRLTSEQYQSVTTADGLPDPMVAGVGEGPEGDLWLGTGSAVLRWGETPTVFGGIRITKSIWSDGQELWVATVRGALRWNGRGFEVVDRSDGLPHDVVRAFAGDRRGRFWIGALSGLVQYDSGRIVGTVMAESIGASEIVSLAAAGDGGLWVGTDRGLVHLLDGQVLRFEEDGVRDGFVRTVIEDRDGTVWLGINNGLTQFDGERIVGTFSTDDGLPHRSVTALLQALDGQLWIGTSGGIATFDGASFETFTQDDGLVSGEVKPQTAFEDSQGRIWFGTVKGAVVFDPDAQPPDLPPPPVYLTGVQVNDESWDTSSQIRLDHDQNRVSFHFLGISLADPEVTYQYRLHGIDESWRTTEHRSVQYQTLPPGDYRFEVRAAHRRGDWSPMPAEFSLVVEPPYWQRWWFRLGAVSLVLALAFAIVQFRVRSIRHRAANLETEVEARTSELSKTLERLHAQQAQLLQAEKMAGLGVLVAGVAHEINNPTNFAHVGTQNLRAELEELHHFLVELAGEDASGRVLRSFDERFASLRAQVDIVLDGTHRIAQLIKDLRAFSRPSSQEPELVDVCAGLETTVHLVHSTFKDDVDLQLDLKARPQITCWPAELNQVFLNLLVNGCQAIRQKRAQQPEQTDEPSVFIVSSRLEGTELVLTFRDSGIGIPKEIEEQIFEPFFTTKDVGEGTGLGLSISYGIVEHHDGRLEFSSRVGEGTTVIVGLPLFGPGGARA